MADAERLTLAFLEAHPGDAARVLERLPTAQAAADQIAGPNASPFRIESSTAAPLNTTAPVA